MKKPVPMIGDQPELDFGAVDRMERGRDELADALMDAVRDLGGMRRAADAIGAREQDLNDAIRQREGRHIRIDWVWALAEKAGAEAEERVARAVNRPMRRVATKAPQLTPEQRLARLEQMVIDEFGPAGARLVERNRR
jgi:hypothetical protein